MVGLSTQSALAGDPQTIGELHPPVVASLGGQKITVFFLKNNLKEQAAGVHVPAAEIFYSALSAAKPTLNYVWKVEGEQIASVFFFERKSPARAGKSMFVLTKNKISHSHFEGDSYSVLELPLFKDGDQLSMQFFRGDPPEPEFQNCRDGLNLEDDVEVECAYKDAASIRKRLAELDAKTITGSKLDQSNLQEPRKTEGDTANFACPSTDFSASLTSQIAGDDADRQQVFRGVGHEGFGVGAGGEAEEAGFAFGAWFDGGFEIVVEGAPRRLRGISLNRETRRGG